MTFGITISKGKVEIYTKKEMDDKLKNKSEITHTHDDRYYTMQNIAEKLYPVKTILTYASKAGVAFNMPFGEWKHLITQSFTAPDNTQYNVEFWERVK